MKSNILVIALLLFSYKAEAQIVRGRIIKSSVAPSGGGVVAPTVTLLTPNDDATSVGINPSLTYSVTNAPTLCTLYLDDFDPPTTVIEADASCDLSFHIDSALDNSTEYFWKIKVENSAGNQTSSVRSFTTVAMGSLSLNTASQMQWVGDYRFAQGAYIDAGNSYPNRAMAMRVVGGKRRPLVAQGANVAGWAPAEFEITATLEDNGTCSAGNCPTQVLGTMPVLPLVANWGLKHDGSSYNFYHDVFDNTCTLAGEPQDMGTAAILRSYFWSNGLLYYNNGLIYGNPQGYNLGAVSLDTPPVDGVSDPVTTSYGKWNISPTSPIYPGESVPRYQGGFRATYLSNRPNGDVVMGSAQVCCTQQGGSPTGFPLFGVTLPGTGTASGCAAADISSTGKWLNWYSQQNNLTVEGEVSPGGTIHGYRHPDYSYRYESASCALNPTIPDCVAHPSAVRVGTSSQRLNPRVNSGAANWGDTDFAFGVLWHETAAYESILGASIASTNWTLDDGMNDNCIINSIHIPMELYCSTGIGDSGFPCSSIPGGLDGDQKTPNYECSLNWIGGPQLVSTGPSTTNIEPRIDIINPADARSVNVGSKVDYTVRASEVVYFRQNWPTMLFGQIPSMSAIVQDPINAHYFWMLIPNVDNTVFAQYFPVLRLMYLP